MGIHALLPLLKKKCPNVFKEIHISKYAYKKIAIDLSLYLCKYKTICGDRWISAFLNLVMCLRKYDVHATFIYDTGAPPEKELERAERRQHKENLENKWFLLNESLQEYYRTGEISENLIELHNKKKEEEPRRFLSKKTNIDMNLVENAINKIKGQIINISPEDYKLTKRLFDILNVPYFQAPLEAETMCSDLCKRELVEAALSEDSDVLAYGSPIFLSKLDTTTGNCIEINYSEILDSLEFTSEQFLDLCIMCGCDYNKNIPRIGPATSLKLIQDYNSIENIKIKTDLDISILNHIRGRELFRNYTQADIETTYCGVPNFEELQEFIVINNINIRIETLRSAFINNITFEE